MEIEQTNHQDVAEPDQMASGVAGTGQKNETETGITKHRTGDKVEFISLTGFERVLQEPGNPDGYSCSPAFGQVAGTTKDPAELTRDPSQVSLKKRQKNKLVIGMGVLYNGEIKPAINRSPPAAPEFLAMEETLEDLVISLYERQERIADRAIKKIELLKNRLTLLKEQRRSV